MPAAAAALLLLAAAAAAWDCSVYGCTCQGMSDRYGTMAGVGFGCAPDEAQSWWKKQPCGTSPAAGAALAGCALCSTWETDPGACLELYDVTWSELLPESNTTWVNTMPLGNGAVAANVFADSARGSVSALLAHSAAWNEAGELLKAGLVEVSFSPNPFSLGPHFRQRLDLAAGTVLFEIGGNSSATRALDVSVRVDAGSDTLVIEPTTPNGRAFNLSAAVRNVRPSPVPAFKSAFGCREYAISADVIVPGSAAPVLWYHRNAADAGLWDHLVADQNLGSAARAALPDLLANRTTGGALFAVGGAAVARAGAALVTAAPTADLPTVGVAVVTEQTDTVAHWVEAASAAAAAGVPAAGPHRDWWRRFWARSHLEVRSNDTTAGYTVSRQYILQRFLQGAQARSPYPIKFNGELFTANRPPNVDARQWGGLNWWQNVRMPYYNMLAAGDADMLQSLCESFLRSFPVAQARCNHYYNASCAFWPEYSHALFGTTNPSSYGCDRAGATTPPYWYSEDRWNHYNVQGGLDLSLFVLDHFSYTGDRAALGRYLPMVEQLVAYYPARYPERDPTGRLLLYPTQAVETWQCPGYPPQKANCATNDAPTIAGLRSVLEKLLRLPEGALPEQRKRPLRALQGELPPLPSRDGALAPCEECPPKTSNVENPELYPVHPYRLLTAGRLQNASALAPALAAYRRRLFPGDVGWNQCCMDAALLGLAAEARRLVEARAASPPAAGYRFPAFMPNYFNNYPPSNEHLAVFSAALQYMLLQQSDDEAQGAALLPAWPCEWNATFTLHAPQRTVIRGTVAGGVASYSVSPPQRAPSVRLHRCQ
eukprot:TRINITY_DN4743_c0_g1_i1.p1 TRINITY_DN4743_c0_g1~~TRINITY_DN4743_c0_g1_i1.p1  ORF type:complete len:826 (+),score=267.49 TRINITY_DN4743_c0_g1_i1:83-2560(+)